MRTINQLNQIPGMGKFTLYLYLELINSQKLILDLKGFGQAIQLFISSIYEARWDSLKANNLNKTFRQNVTSKFTLKITNKKHNKKVKLTNEGKQAEVVTLILSRPSKETLEKSKFFQKKCKNSKKDSYIKGRYIYTQVSALKVKKILKLKRKFP